jgi:hypothetical protein
VVQAEGPPHHHGASTKADCLPDSAIQVPLSASSPDVSSAIIVEQTEAGLVTEEDLSPLLTVPSPMTSAEGAALSSVVRRQLASHCWAVTQDVCSMKGIPKGLHTDVDVRVRPQLLSDEACRGEPVRYGLARDVAILPSGCLLWASRAGSILQSSSGQMSMPQSGTDRGRHPKLSDHLSHGSVSLQHPQGPAPILNTQLSSRWHG